MHDFDLFLLDYKNHKDKELPFFFFLLADHQLQHLVQKLVH